MQVSPRPGFETTPLAHSLYLANLFFIGAFTVEALIKITAMGFVSHKYSYLRDHWNKLDLVSLMIPLHLHPPSLLIFLHLPPVHRLRVLPGVLASRQLQLYEDSATLKAHASPLQVPGAQCDICGHREVPPWPMGYLPLGLLLLHHLWHCLPRALQRPPELPVHVP